MEVTKWLKPSDSVSRNTVTARVCRKSSDVTCVSLHAPAHNRTGGFPAYGSGLAYLGDDAVGFFDAITAVHANLGACLPQPAQARWRAPYREKPL